MPHPSIKSPKQGADRPPLRIEFSLNDALQCCSEEVSLSTDYSSKPGDSVEISPPRSSTRSKFQGSCFRINEEGDNHRTIHTRQVAKSGYNIRVTGKTPAPQSLLDRSGDERPTLAHPSSANATKREHSGQKNLFSSPKNCARDRSPKAFVSPKAPLSDNPRLTVSQPNMEALYRESIHNMDTLYRESIHRNHSVSSRRASTSMVRSPETCDERRGNLVVQNSWHHSTSRSSVSKYDRKLGSASPTRGETERLTRSLHASEAAHVVTNRRQNESSRPSIQSQSSAERSKLEHPSQSWHGLENKRRYEQQHRPGSQPQQFQCQSSASKISPSLKLPTELSDEKPSVRQCSLKPQRSQSSPKLLTNHVISEHLDTSRLSDGEPKVISSRHTHYQSSDYFQHKQAGVRTPIRSVACPYCCNLLPSRFICCQAPSTSPKPTVSQISGVDEDNEETDRLHVIPKVVYVSNLPDQAESPYPSSEKQSISPNRPPKRRSMGSGAKHYDELGMVSNHSTGHRISGRGETTTFSQKRRGSVSGASHCFELSSQFISPHQRTSLGLVTRHYEAFAAPHNFQPPMGSEQVPSKFAMGSCRNSLSGETVRRHYELGHCKQQQNIEPPKITSWRRKSLI